MDRDELIRIASREAASILVFTDPGTKGQIRSISDQIAENVIKVVEPPIRADERGIAQIEACQGHIEALRHAEQRLADLRAKVEALRTGFWASDYDAAIRDVLALLDGGSES